jgi:phage gpG-like protein
VKKLNLKPKIAAMQRLKVNLPKQLGNDAVNHFRNSFRLGGFEDQSVDMWELPKRKQFTTFGKKGQQLKGKKYLFKNFSRADRTRATLVQTGALRNSVRVLRTSPGEVVIGSDLKYAQIHNEGGKLKNGGTMPKRQYVGDSRKLTAQMKKKISGEILKALKI